MIDEALKEFNKRTHMMDKRLEKSMLEFKIANEKIRADLRADMTKLNNRTITLIVSILSGLILLTGTIGHWLAH